MASKPSCSRTASALAMAASLQMTTPAVADDATPRLGVSPVRDVIQAMTLEEKVALVLGQGMAGMSGGMQGPVVGVDTNSRVPGAAGTTFPIARLGIPSIVRLMDRRACASTRRGTTRRIRPSMPRPFRLPRCWPAHGTMRWSNVWARPWGRKRRPMASMSF